MSVLFVKPTRAYRLNSNDCAMQARSLAMTMSLVVVMRVVDVDGRVKKVDDRDVVVVWWVDLLTYTASFFRKKASQALIIEAASRPFLDKRYWKEK